MNLLLVVLIEVFSVSLNVSDSFPHTSYLKVNAALPSSNPVMVKDLSFDKISLFPELSSVTVRFPVDAAEN